MLAPVNAIERRLEAVDAIQRGGNRRYFSFSASVLASLSNAAKESRENGRAKIQRRYREPAKSKTVERSSSK